MKLSWNSSGEDEEDGEEEEGTESKIYKDIINAISMEQTKMCVAVVVAVSFTD